MGVEDKKATFKRNVLCKKGQWNKFIAGSWS